jgi:hypothetical protein
MISRPNNLTRNIFTFCKIKDIFMAFEVLFYHKQDLIKLLIEKFLI